MDRQLDVPSVRERLVFKTVRNIRNLREKEETAKEMYRPGIKLDLQRSRILTESYKQTEGEPMVIRRAKALERILTRMDLYIQDWERIVGNNVPTPQGLYFGIDMNWRSVRRVVNSEEGSALLTADEAAELEELIKYWKGKSMSDIQQNMFSGDILKYWDMSQGGAGFWSHWSELGIPDYEKIFRVGLGGLIRQAEGRLEEIDRHVPVDYIDQKEFLQAVIIALQAVIKLAHRYADMARERAARSDDPEDRNRLEAIARTCERVPEHPPQTLFEALQSFFFIHVVRYIEYSTLGIGVRFDKVFGPYYQDDLRNNRTTREEALELLQLLWVKFHELGLIYSPTLTAAYGGVASLQAITLGGVDEHGNDITNEMTYLVLETAERMKTPEPSIALRYHDGTPDELLSRATDVIRTGIGYPSLFNDKSIIPLLEHWDVPLKDARDYAVTGCVYIEIPGKNIVRRAYGAMILPLALWYALNQGKHPVTGRQSGAPTPDPLTFTSADDLMAAYLEQVEFFFGRLCKIQNTCQTLYEKYLPRPYYSALIEGCIEQGKDCRRWIYPSPVSDFCVILGPSNVADAVTAVKKNVFQDKTVTMEELLEAMKANWVGYEKVRRLMIKAPKFGNDDDYADAIAAEVHHRTAEVMARSKNRFGFACRGDGSGISATYGAGAAVPATPDGRRDGEPLADATLSPVFGMDQRGPTAVLKSAAKISTERTHNHLLNQKFLPDALAGDMKPVFMSYLRSWGDLGISHIQFNVVDRETLVDAQAHPEKHSDLLVRVAGYSAYFVDLSKGLQDSIIARTQQGF
jgi:pyruvate formate-lyase/glycerol dehydratase family glycyl radical enzyme